MYVRERPDHPLTDFYPVLYLRPKHQRIYDAIFRLFINHPLNTLCRRLVNHESILRENRGDNFLNSLLYRRFVGDGASDRRFTGPPGMDALFHQSGGIDQQPGTHSLTKHPALQVSHLLTNLGQTRGPVFFKAALSLNDFFLSAG